MGSDEDDVVPVGKLRRVGAPSAAVSYDPTYGIRIEGEDAPPEPQAAAAWCRRAGWLRLHGPARRARSGPVRDFVKAWRTR
ncbi:MAG: hypothetical protein V4510_09775 [bacterium]